MFTFWHSTVESLEPSNDLGTPADPSDDDGNGDLDLYKIDFSLVYSHWENNFKGKDVRSLGGDLQVGGDRADRLQEFLESRTT